MSTAEDAMVTARSTHLYSRYARAVDESDLDALREMVTDDISITQGSGPARGGIEVFLDVYRAHIAQKIPVCRHVVSNVLAERVDGSSAEISTRAYFEATMFEQSRTRVVYGIYRDIHREIDGELVLAHKKIHVQRTLELPAAAEVYAHVGVTE